MQLTVNNYIFSKAFNYFINMEEYNIYLYNKACYFIVKIPSFFYYKLEKEKVSFLLIHNNLFLSFIKLITTYYKKLFSFYFFKLKLRGLGYRIRVISNSLIKIFFNRSNYYYMHISSKIIFKYRTRQLFFFGAHYVSLYLTLLNLIYLKENIKYRLSGILYPQKIYLLKPGKNKFR